MSAAVLVQRLTWQGVGGGGGKLGHNSSSSGGAVLELCSEQVAPWMRNLSNLTGVFLLHFHLLGDFFALV